MAFNQYNYILIIITGIVIILLLLNTNKKEEKKNDEGFINPFNNIFSTKKNNKSETFQDNNKKCDCPIRPIEAKRKIGKVNRILEEERVLAEKQKKLRNELGELSKEIAESRVQPIPQKGIMATPLVDTEKANIEITQELEAKKALSDKMININYYCNGNKENKINSINTDSNSLLNTDIDCLNLNQTGFNNNWNYDNVKKLYQTSSGKQLMKRIDNNFKTLSGKSLSNNIISKCYPSYFNSNILSDKSLDKSLDKSSNKSLDNNKKETKNNDNQEEFIRNEEYSEEDNDFISQMNISNMQESLSPIILMTDDEQDSKDVNLNLINISPDSNDDEYDELSEMISESFQNKNTKKKILNNFTPKLTKCDLSSLRIEIRSSIARHYTNKVNMMEKENLFPVGLNKQKVYADYQKNFDYMIDRAMLEIQNLIMNYKDKKFSIYQNEINRLKIRSPSGLSLMGTDYYIPWTLINKYEVCFAKVENNKPYPVQYKN